MQTYIVIVSGSIVNVSTVHLNGIRHLIWRYLSKPVIGGHPVLRKHYSIPRGYPLNAGFAVFNKKYISKLITYEMSTKHLFSHLHFPLAPAVNKILWFSVLCAQSKEKNIEQANAVEKVPKKHHSLYAYSLTFSGLSCKILVQTCERITQPVTIPNFEPCHPGLCPTGALVPK